MSQEDSKFADGQVFGMHEGRVQVWLEQEAIHVRIVERGTRDPVELTADEARQLAQHLIKLADEVK